MVEPFEVTHYKLEKSQAGKLDEQTAVGVSIGKSLSSDEHYVGTAHGFRRCRTAFCRTDKIAGMKRSSPAWGKLHAGAEAYDERIGDCLLKGKTIRAGEHELVKMDEH